MRLLLLALIGITVSVYVAFVAFMAWFTIAFFGSELAQWLFACVLIATGVAVTAYGVNRWRKVWRGEHVRV